MTCKVSLQAHESTGSYDSRTDLGMMLDAYREQDFDAVGFVGHDALVDVEGAADDLILYSGIEHTVDRAEGTYVVEFPEYDFRYLARPSYRDKHVTPQEVLETAREHDVDAVEKYTNAWRQYDGNLPLVEVASDGAHNPQQVGSSYMLVDVDVCDRDAIMQAVMEGNFEIVNGRRSVLGNLGKGIAVAAHQLANHTPD